MNLSEFKQLFFIPFFKRRIKICVYRKSSNARKEKIVYINVFLCYKFSLPVQQVVNVREFSFLLSRVKTDGIKF